MSLTATLDLDVSQIDNTREQYCADGTLAYSGSFAAHGDTLDLSQLGLAVGGLAINGLPTKVEIYEVTTAANKPAFGGAFLYLPGTTLANGVVEIFNGTTELTATAATYASIFGSVAVALRFRVWYKS
jgi:hypothetical protein